MRGGRHERYWHCMNGKMLWTERNGNGMNGVGLLSGGDRHLIKVAYTCWVKPGWRSGGILIAFKHSGMIRFGWRGGERWMVASNKKKVVRMK